MRLKYFDVTPELFSNLFMNGTVKSWKVIKGLPKNAKIVRAEFVMIGYPLNIIRFVVESKYFKELKEAEEIPRIEITCEEVIKNG